MNGGHLIPDALAEQIAKMAVSSMHDSVTAILIHPDDLTWEAKLQFAIERQSVRNRLRRAVAHVRFVLRDIPRRLRNVRAALAGDWDAGDDW